MLLQLPLAAGRSHTAPSSDRLLGEESDPLGHSARSAVGSVLSPAEHVAPDIHAAAELAAAGGYGDANRDGFHDGVLPGGVYGPRSNILDYTSDKDEDEEHSRHGTPKRKRKKSGVDFGFFGRRPHKALDVYGSPGQPDYHDVVDFLPDYFNRTIAAPYYERWVRNWAAAAGVTKTGTAARIGKGHGVQPKAAATGSDRQRRRLGHRHGWHDRGHRRLKRQTSSSGRKSSKQRLKAQRAARMRKRKAASAARSKRKKAAQRASESAKSKSDKKGTDFYGSIVSTTEQRFGRKHQEKIRKLQMEAQDAKMVTAYSSLISKILKTKLIRKTIRDILGISDSKGDSGEGGEGKKSSDKLPRDAKNTRNEKNKNQNKDKKKDSDNVSSEEEEDEEEEADEDDETEDSEEEEYIDN